MKKITLFENLKTTYSPAILLVVLLFLFIFSLKTGISKISELRESLDSQKKIELVLKQKEEYLKNVDDNVFDQAAVANVALPDKNPVLFSMSQIKNLAADGSVQLSNIKVGSSNTETAGITKIAISFDMEGQIGDVLGAINKLKNFIPLIVVEKIDFKIGGSMASATVGVSSFWSPFPAKIPPLTQPMRDIPPEERDILDSLFSYTRPSFVDLLPQELTAREDPFR